MRNFKDAMAGWAIRPFKCAKCGRVERLWCGSNEYPICGIGSIASCDRCDANADREAKRTPSPHPAPIEREA